jgi:hypothetical protein
MQRIVTGHHRLACMVVSSHHDQPSDAQYRLDGARASTLTDTTGYTFVVSARPMMWVSADTTESPVTTL